MGDLKKLQNIYFVLIDFIFILIICIIHFVFYFYIKETDFSNIFDIFESSPLFDFSLDIDCGAFDHVVFHVWEGREVSRSYSTRGHVRSRTETEDITEITKISWNNFCFKKTTYKDLLYNGQIIKKGKTCPQEYIKNCGTIDTLEQELCIKDTENCPLYDVGLGVAQDTTNYINHEDIYYNNDNYNEENKKIIGKLILNEGQPCYKLEEKLWRKFVSDEVGEEHLKCEFEVFGKLNDDRYENRGDITYKKIYNSNINILYDLLFKDVDDQLNNYKVTLYKREFLGIDKACDEKANISKDNYEKLRYNEKGEKLCLLIEAILIFSDLLGLIIYIIVIKCKRRKYKYKILLIFLIICLSLNLISIICQSVFLGRIIKYNFSYDCSDEITNEITRLEHLNTKKSIIYSSINLGADVLYILFNGFAFLIAVLEKKCGNCKINLFSKNKDKKTVNHKDNKNQNKIRINNFDKDSIREIIVKRKEQNIYERNSDRSNNNNDISDNNDISNKNVNIDDDINPRIDLSVPPSN